MALDVARMIGDAVLSLSKNKSISRITVKDIQDETGFSRQTFYNHFKDMEDLLQYIYRERIVIHWDPEDPGLDFCEYLIRDLSMTREYRQFLKNALRIQGQNSLREYMIDYCIQFDLQWMRTFYGAELPDRIVRTVIYQSTGSMELKIQWLLGELECSLYELAESIINNRSTGLGPLIWPGAADTPYTRAAAKIADIKAGLVRTEVDIKMR